MGRYTLLRIAVAALFQAWRVISMSDPIALDGTKAYLMSSVVAGDGYYLQCGNDFQCSLLAISNAQTQDGWTVVDQNDGTVRLYIRNGSWALDVHSDGREIFGNDQPSGQDAGQVWILSSWSDGTYPLYNKDWQGNLDVVDNVTPFVNMDQSENLMGQHWYFRQVNPQVTLTNFLTTTSTVFKGPTSTVTNFVTTCPGSSSQATAPPALHKRGAGILSNTTTYVTSTTSTTVTSSVTNLIQTSTSTVFSCSLASHVVTGTATIPGPTVYVGGSSSSSAPSTGAAASSSSSSSSDSGSGAASTLPPATPTTSSAPTTASASASKTASAATRERVGSAALLASLALLWFGMIL